MALPSIIHGTAKAIYEYAGAEGIPSWDDLSPTVQIFYIEEAEAALKHVSDFIVGLADSIEVEDEEDAHVRGTLRSVIELIDPRLKFDFEI